MVHSVDIDRTRHFPNSFTITSRRSQQADAHTNASYDALSEVADHSYDVVACTGLLEHVPEPGRLIGELHRILRPGGRQIVTGSAVFPFHGAPDNYFHFTSYGFAISSGTGQGSRYCEAPAGRTRRWRSCCSGSTCSVTS